MTVSESNETSPTEKILLRALIVSLLLHLLLFSVWRVGKAQGWWRDLALPRWLQSVSKALMPVIPKKPAVEVPPQTQLSFVEVDPALATPEPPKKPMFEGAKNTIAANRQIKELSVLPNIEGQQEKFLKTTENGKPQPKPVAPSPPQAVVQPQMPPPQSAPKKTYVPGDLAMARPSDLAREGKSEANTSEQPQPQPQPQPPRERPRTIAEALARSGTYGKQSSHVGGVGRIDPNVSLDVKGTPMGDYLARMVEAVQSCWNDLLKEQSPDVTGKVVLRFRLLPDGSVKDVKMLRNEVTDLLEATCEQAIIKPAPFEKWTQEMRQDVANDHYDITFTFYYEP